MHGRPPSADEKAPATQGPGTQPAARTNSQPTAEPTAQPTARTTARTTDRDDRDGGFAAEVNLGELHPVGGGDPIPLLKPQLLIGRRESADIVLRFANVSGSHCTLWLEGGSWHVRDLKSSNGTKVNGERVIEQRLAPGDRLSVGRHHFEVHYEPVKLGGAAAILDDDSQFDVFSRSLLHSAGLERRRPPGPSAPPSGRPRR